MKSVRQTAFSARDVARSWFALTPDEQRAVLLVLALLLLGLGVRAWRLQGRAAPAAEPAREAAGFRVQSRQME